MRKEEIINLFIEKIPENHILNYHVHLCKKHSLSRTVHPFLGMMSEALEYLDNLMPTYANRIVTWLSTLVNKSEYEQNFAVFGEILVLFKVAKVANCVNGQPYIVPEPSSKKDSKNPEFRSNIQGIYYAGEVKTPSLAEYIYNRQSGIQITTHLPDRDIFIDDKIISPNILRIRDNLVNTHNKYKEYIQKPEYKEDYRFLFIVWDDFINEPISALINPYCGLFTKNTFYPESDFNLIDGVFIIRHLHQFRRILRNEEFMYDLVHAFDWPSEQYPVAFVQNPNGRKVPDVFIEKFSAINPNDMLFAEYRPTDWVDWRTGIALIGLSSIPKEYHKRIVEIVRESADTHLDLALPESANFGVLNLDKFVEESMESNGGSVNYEKVMVEFSDAILLAKQAQVRYEQMEKEYQLKQSEEIYKSQLETLKRALGVNDQFLIKPLITSVNINNHSKNLMEEKVIRNTIVGRNEKCPCGSGLKYKRCCLEKDFKGMV
ncbi:YecA family protein [Peribacillus frigoritolerans]|uniref:SEC-C domain-containing protein n=1 Tax=Peribacillus frigoritolerans TaxID=450367 RepID=A0AAJ1QLV7_9BACI|nr:SEC-C domain-containing protein [Peribacillus frigoritolerans]MDM5283803.1 SEC-C domain-containing protein [Peribacillus frigoritolerans]